MAKIDNVQDQPQSDNKTQNKIIQTLKSIFLFDIVQKIKTDKKFLIILIAITVAVIMFLVLLIIFASKPQQKPKITTKEQSTPIADADTIQKLIDVALPEPSSNLQSSSIDNLIIKANLLYSQGHRQEAFSVFRKVANFSQSIATYNLGTIQLANNAYEDAISSYADSIQTGQNVSVSAINAAVSSYKLDRFDLYHYYLKVANDHLLDSVQEPYYSYTYALLEYYKEHYFEALSPLLNPNSKDFNYHNMRLAAKIFTLFGDDENAVQALLKTSSADDNKSIGLLYARLGEYAKAKTHLAKHLQNHSNDIESIMATQIIELKLGNFSFAAAALDRISQNQKHFEIAKKTYPIKIIINPELFDVSLAQKTFWERDFENNDKIGYKALFYFAPYKVFDAKTALKEASRGVTLHQVNIQEGKNVLLRSATTSKLDKLIIEGLVRLETKDLRYALKMLKNATNNNPNHAILYYNLGLIYAQLGYYDDAYIHFIRAYHLDQSDYLSGALAIISGRFSHKNTERIASELMHTFQNDTSISSPSQRIFIQNLLNYINGSHIENSEWIKQVQAKEPIFYALQFAYALHNKDKKEMIKNIEGLQAIYPRDVVVNILHMLSSNFGENLKENAIHAYHILKSDVLDLHSIYYGGAFPRELYVYSGFISGSLQEQARIVQDYLIAHESNTNGILQTLGLIYLYQQDFQKAYAIYNTLLDDLQENDGQTRFLAAVSAIGSENYGNAALLLQLTKMETPSIYEARYGLGLLYQTAKNFKAAATNYRFILPENFRSNFFDFQIDAQANQSYELQDISQ